MLAGNASGIYQCKQTSNNEPNIVFFAEVSRRLWYREQCHKKGTVVRKNFVVILFPVGTNPLNAELNPICHLLALLGGATIVVVSRLRVNADMNDETKNFVSFTMRNAYLRGQITFLFTIHDVQNTKPGPATG